MKQAKVLNYKRIRTSTFSWGWGIRALVRVGLRMLIACLPLVPFIALAVPFLLPETPHLRIQYTYAGSYNHPIYRECQYFGNPWQGSFLWSGLPGVRPDGETVTY